MLQLGTSADVCTVLSSESFAATRESLDQSRTFSIPLLVQIVLPNGALTLL